MSNFNIALYFIDVPADDTTTICSSSSFRFPDQRLTRLEALRGMTIDPAYASFSEDRLGSLEPGKRADYVVLSKDIMDEDLEFEEVVETRVVATVIDGRVVFGEV